MVRREALQRVGGFEESFTGRNQLYEDQAFLAKLYLQESVFVSNECWDRYRVHEDSCDAIVKKSGERHAARLFFLNWLKAYLADKSVEDADLITNLRNAFVPYMVEADPDQTKLADSLLSDDSETRRMNWWLKVEEDNLASLDILDDTGDAVRVAITHAGTSLRHDIQLNHTRLKLHYNKTYVVHFMARADRDRSIAVGVAKNYPPWSNLGLYDEIRLASNWRSFGIQFVAAADAENARIHFDVGNSTIFVEVSAVRVLSLSDNRFIDPEIPSIREVR
jgi:hypothetical protein